MRNVGINKGNFSLHADLISIRRRDSCRKSDCKQSIRPIGFQGGYHTHYPDREKENEEEMSFPQNSIMRFTDGSKLSAKVDSGAGIYAQKAIIRPLQLRTWADTQPYFKPKLCHTFSSSEWEH